MSVESCTPATPKAATSGAGHSAKGKMHAAGEAGAADAGGFSALLMQLGANDADVAADTSGELTSAAEGATPELLVGETKSVVDGAQQVDPNLLLAQSMQFQPGRQHAPSGHLQSHAVQLQQIRPSVVKGPEGGLAEPVQIDGAQQRAQPEGLSLTPDSAPTSVSKGADVIRPELGEANKEIKDVAAKAPASQRSVPRAAVTDMAAPQASAVNTGASLAIEARLHKQAQVEPRGESSPGLAQTLAVSGLSETGVRRAERVGENMEHGQGSKGDGAWGHQALLATGSAEPSSFTMAAPTAVMSPEAMVAEQVNYWIGHDVQNAELKLDGMGDSPVEVSISLQGNEARVEFRTDQLEARQVLEGAVSHLKDLLGNEGLVLSGVSVGSSGADGAPSQERRERQNGRQAAVVVPDLKSVDMNTRPARVSDRSVDLFV